MRLGEVETLEYQRDRGLGVTVYFGRRKGSASTSDWREPALLETVRAACDIARYTAEDPWSASPIRPGWRARRCRNSTCITVGAQRQAIDIARDCEAAAARGFDARISNSDGASVGRHESLVVCGNSNGFPSAAIRRRAIRCRAR